MSRKKVCILGAGLSGLSLALSQERKGNKVSLFEKDLQVGGVLQSIKSEGYLLDYGANTLSIRTKNTENYLKQHKILEHALDANQECSKRFIVKKNQVISLPQGPLSFLTSSFLSPLGKMRLCIEPFIPRKKDNSADETMASFVKRRLGKQALDYGANPFIGGVYASRPESLILKHAFPSLYETERKFGSIFWGMIRGGIQPSEKLPHSRLVSFKEGMQELPKRLAEKLSIPPVLGCEIKKIEFKNKSKWCVHGEAKDGKIKEELFDQVISTLPSHALLKIEWIGIQAPHLFKTLAQTFHPPLALCFQGFKRQQIQHPLDGFGFLVPEKEKRKILGTLFSSTLFQNRAPKNYVLLTTFVGGERNPELCNLPDNEILEYAYKENQKLLGIEGKPTFEHIKLWPKSIPIPDSTLDARIKAASTLSIKNKGLQILGSHLNGAPLPNCMVL